MKDFVLAWLYGEIDIDFPIAEEIASKEPPTGFVFKPIVTQTHYKREIEEKTPFLENVNVFLGKTTASEEEILTAIDNLIEWIVKLRSAKRIKGKFGDTELSSRMNRLDRDMYRIERAIEEIKMLLKGAGIL